MINLSSPFADGAAHEPIQRPAFSALSFSKSVELHDKVIGHYLNIKHYQ
nr:IS1 family transposase [Escherichia coli]